MEISQGALAWLYLYAWLLGMGLGAFYDVFRITRVFLGVHYSRRAARRLQEIRLPLLKPQRKRSESHALGIVIFLEDLIFCIVAGIALVLLFYQANNGKFRFPVLLLSGGGFLFYRGTVGRTVMLFSEVIAFFIETAVRYAVFFLLFPFRLVFGWMGKQLRRAMDHTVRAERKHRRRRYTADEKRRVSRDGCGMIPEDVSKYRTLKRGKRIGKRKENTVQPDMAHARVSRTARRGVGRHICK